MGHPPPPTPPVINEDLYYDVSVLAYQDILPGCEGEPMETHCCILGWYIIFFVDLGECLNGNEVCMFSGYSAQKIVDIAGPFGTLQECIDSW